MDNVSLAVSVSENVGMNVVAQALSSVAVSVSLIERSMTRFGERSSVAVIVSDKAVTAVRRTASESVAASVSVKESLKVFGPPVDARAETGAADTGEKPSISYSAVVLVGIHTIREPCPRWRYKPVIQVF